MDAGSLDNKQEQMKSWPAIRKKKKKSMWLDLKIISPMVFRYERKRWLQSVPKKRWEGSPLWQSSALQENWISRAETWCVLMGEAPR